MPVQQGRGRASSLSRMVDSYEESSFYERSTSVPKQFYRPYEIKKTTEMIRKRKDGLFISSLLQSWNHNEIRKEIQK